MTNSTTEVSTGVADLIDRAEIRDVISRLGRYLDELRIDELDQIFTDDVISQFPGGEPLNGLEALRQHASKHLPQWALRQHVITNVLIDLAGDEASVRANLIATHVHREEDRTSHWDLGAYYDFEARRADDGWHLTRVILNRVWTAGPTS